VIDFVNFKIKSSQSFKGDHWGRIYMYMFIRVSAHTCISICVCTVFLKKRYQIIFRLFKTSPQLKVFITMIRFLHMSTKY
jgi:hypothetical protein